jgi:hypothetical protein
MVRAAHFFHPLARDVRLKRKHATVSRLARQPLFFHDAKDSLRGLVIGCGRKTGVMNDLINRARL